MPRYRVTVWRRFEVPTNHTVQTSSELEAKKEGEQADIVAWGHSRGIIRVEAKLVEPNPAIGGRHENI